MGGGGSPTGGGIPLIWPNMLRFGGIPIGGGPPIGNPRPCRGIAPIGPPGIIIGGGGPRIGFKGPPGAPIIEGGGCRTPGGFGPILPALKAAAVLQKRKQRVEIG